MSDGDALYEAILAAPADDLPRLVYADWLEEHGDTERAEFIRLQIDLVQNPHPGPIVVKMAREKYLLDRYKEKWSIPGLRGGQNFFRGFVEEVWAAYEDVVKHANALGRVPLRSLRITAVGSVDALVGLPVLAKIQTLDLSNNVNIHQRFDRLFSNGGLRSLNSLVLRNVRVWGEDLPRWPMIPGFPKLMHLDLSGNPVGDDGLIVLVNHPGFDSLTSLTLRGDEQDYEVCVHANGMHQLAASVWLAKITHLDLASQYVGDAGLTDLARSAHVGRLVKLDLSDNDIGEIGDSGIEALAASDRFVSLRELSLRENRLGPVGAAALARWNQLETIDRVDLTRCEMSENSRRELLDSPWARKFELDESPAYM